MRYIVLFLLISSPLHSLKFSYKKEAEKVLDQSILSIIDNLNNDPSPDDLLPNEDKGKEFDGEQAREDVLNQNIKTNSVVRFLEENPVESTHFSEVESEIFEGKSTVGSDSEEYIKTCKESSDPIRFTLVRTLEFDLVKEIVSKEVKIERCLGHRKEEKVARGEGKKEKKRKEEMFKADSTVAWSSVEWKDRGMWHRDIVISKWRHIDNCSSCNSKKSCIELVEKEREKLIDDGWKYNSDQLKDIAEGPNTSFLSKKCLDNTPRMINGNEHSKCWVEQFTFLYSPLKIEGCKFLKSQFCKLKSSECLKHGPFGCILWNRTFQCYKKLNKISEHEVDADELGLNDPVFETEYEPNKGFSDIATKLEVFNEMERDMKNSQSIDIKGFEFFSGNSMRCYVHALEGATYDCCEKMGGLAVDGLISKCDEDEIALFDLRNRGQCHYVGDKDEKVLGIKTSKKHVYCCFSSKLSRVFNEQSRKQLGIGWGDADNPNCGGLTQAHIEKINFDSIDLSEAFEAPEGDLQERIDRLKNKISEGVEKKEG